MSLLEDDLIRDQIPFDDISSIEIMHEPKDIENLLSRFRETQHAGRSNVKDNRRQSTQSSLASNNSFATRFMSRVFQIRTIQDGFNSGRTYYFQTDSKENCEIISDDLRKYAVCAKKRAEKLSKFQKSQNIALAVYESTHFQAFSAFLIVMVCFVFLLGPS